MTSAERVKAALSLKEPDRVPWLLLLTMTGARELGLSIKDYFSSGKNVAEGQLRMRAKYGHDVLYSFFFAALEMEAWGGEVIYCDDGPPNCGAPVIKSPEAIETLSPPRIEDSPSLLKVLDATAKMKEGAGGEVPVLGVVISPFSLPVMQMGFEPYLLLLYERPELFKRLMEVNEEFAAAWGRAQLKAGADAICYFDPVSSPTIIPRELYLKTGFPVAKRTVPAIGGPLAAHFASGRCIPLIDDLVAAGIGAMCAGCEEDLARVKRASEGKIALVGNLNGLEMRSWTPGRAEEEVKKAIRAGGPGGGFLLSDSHGEIPWQVPDDVLSAMSEAVRKQGRYPLEAEG
ncbi:MAG: methylcobamide--CoM methyltransferase MtbA [Synergistaceae bacterium]|nr:methylcobamide--CoM methyltransferase MtbA [Synergistaceae bacterium]